MKKHRDLFFVTLSLLIGIEIASLFLYPDGLRWLEDIASFHINRPFVFRVLIPLLSQLIHLISGLGLAYSMIVVLILSPVFVYLSIRYLYRSFQDDGRAGSVAILGTIFVYAVTFFQWMFYDLPTAALFSLALAFLARRKYWAYYILFPIATLNRETTFLLTAVYAVWAFRGLSRRHWILGGIYQACTYIIIKFSLNFIFHDRPGLDFYFIPDVVVMVYAEHIYRTLLLIAICMIIFFWIARRWQEKPPFLRLAFLVIFPIQVLLHIFLGHAFETRVFAEIAPVIAILLIYPSSHGVPILSPEVQVHL